MKIIKITSCSECVNNSDETYCEFAVMIGISNKCPLEDYKEPKEEKSCSSCKNFIPTPDAIENSGICGVTKYSRLTPEGIDCEFYKKRK